MAIRFSLGKVVMTQGVAALADMVDIAAHLVRHRMGDWGSIDREDKRTNDDAMKHGGRILSAYPIDPSLPCKGWGENTIWIITEADRSVTTLLLPDEY